MDLDFLKNIFAIGAIAFLAYKDFKKQMEDKKAKLNQPKKNNESIEITNEINKMVILLREKVGCSRVEVMGFLNGSFDFRHISQKKISVMYEDVEEGTSRIIEIFQLKPIQTMIQTLTEIKLSPTGWMCYGTDTTNEAANNLRKSLGIKRILHLRFTEDISDGFISCHWCDEDITVTDEHIRLTRYYADRIDFLLMQLSENEKNK